MGEQMARPEVTEAGSRIEVWEAQAPGTVWVWVYDRREDKYEKKRVGGRQGGSKRLHITTDDRRFNQEQIVEEMRDSDPFINGSLRLIDGKHDATDVDTRYHLTLEDLKDLLEVRDEDEFKATVDGFASELVIRRLSQVADTYGQGWQVEHIHELIADRYSVGNSQASIREEDNPAYRGVRLYS